MTTTPQPGIFAVGTRSHHHLQLDVDPGADRDALFAALRDIREQATTVAGVNLVIGFGSLLCERLAPHCLPDGIEPFETITGIDEVTIPAEQHDLWIWLHSSGPDGVFVLSRHVESSLRGLATVVSEQPSFTYQGSRDLTGFEDGTENPPLDEAIGLVTVPAGRAGAGSSVVLLQRWVHDLEAFDALDDMAKDQVIGRDLASGDELDERVRSPRAHISRVTIRDSEGAELEVFRRSTAFGGVLEHGLVFLAFSPDVERLATMLHRMVGAEDGLRDHLTDISRCRASAWYVAPPVEAFADQHGCRQPQRRAGN
jgi:putative iron-dependent peroxidase